MKDGRVVTEKFNEPPGMGSFVLRRHEPIRMTDDITMESVQNVVIKSDNLSYPILECQWETYSQKIGAHVKFNVVIFDNKEYAAIYE